MNAHNAPTALALRPLNINVAFTLADDCMPCIAQCYRIAPATHTNVDNQSRNY